MLKLCRYTGSKTETDYVDAIVNAYQQILAKCDASGITWVQFEEPALVWDMDENDISLFHKSYDELLAAKKSCKVLIQTYFGDVRAVYRDLIAMPFDGIGLDFIEGKQTFELIEKNGFPEDEVLDLEANGIRIIQIDEAALREKLPLRRSDWYTEYLDFAIPAFRLTHSGVKPETQIHTHMCYSEFTDIIPAIDDMDADVITFEASRSDLQILDSLRENHFETEVGPGVYDIHSPRVPSVEEIVNVLQIMLTQIEKDKLWVNPDCGLKTRGVKETDASLRNMVEAAAIIRKEVNSGLST